MQNLLIFFLTDSKPCFSKCSKILPEVKETTFGCYKENTNGTSYLQINSLGSNSSFLIINDQKGILLFCQNNCLCFAAIYS